MPKSLTQTYICLALFLPQQYEMLVPHDRTFAMLWRFGTEEQCRNTIIEYFKQHFETLKCDTERYCQETGHSLTEHLRRVQDPNYHCDELGFHLLARAHGSLHITVLGYTHFWTTMKQYDGKAKQVTLGFHGRTLQGEPLYSTLVPSVKNSMQKHAQETLFNDMVDRYHLCVHYCILVTIALNAPHADPYYYFPRLVDTPDSPAAGPRRDEEREEGAVAIEKHAGKTTRAITPEDCNIFPNI